MRLVAYVPAKPERKVPPKRIIIATSPQSVEYYPPGWVVMFGGYYAEGEDGPAMMAFAAPTIEDALAELEENNPGCHREWREYPDQIPGCQDDWLGPVRVYRDGSGARVPGRWQRMIDGQWIEVFPSNN